MKLLETQKYSECQLVAVINAAAYLGQPLVDPNSEEYERLVDLVCARTGSAIRIDLAIHYLRLVHHDLSPVTVDRVRMQVMSGHPVSATIWHHGPGFHEILLTDGGPKSVKAWNLGIKGYPKGRVSWERLGELMGAAPHHCRKVGWYELDPLKTQNRKSVQ